jgi:hypothetical protein
VSGVQSASSMTGKSSQRASQVALIALMAIGSVALWLAMPVFWLWLGSQMQKSSQPSMGPYLLVIAGIVISAVLISKGLAAADRAYGRLMTVGEIGRRRLPWHRSMRGERDIDAGQPVTVLSRVMVISVGVALFSFGVWFFLFAGSSLPGQ